MITTMTIELNGLPVTGLVEGVEQFVTTIREKDSGGNPAKSFSSELTFYGDGYNILKTALIDDVNGFSKQVKVKIWDSCCYATAFEGVIKGDAIDWCEPGCFITANVVEETPELNCMASTMIWDDFAGFSARPHPPIRYCVEARPEWISHVVIWLAFIINIVFFLIMLPTVAIIFVIFSIIYAICSLIDLICSIPVIGCNGPDCNTGMTNPAVAIGNVIDAIRELNEMIIPCGRYHPSPYVRDYIINVCQKCGLTFQSSILNDPVSPRYNTVLFAAQIKRGKKKTDTDFALISDNRPVETLQSLLDDYLVPTFNGEWKVKGSTLIFERKDYFSNGPVWLDTEYLLHNGDIIDDRVCYNWQDRPRYAFGRFSYQPDAMDVMCAEARERWNDIVDWNIPYNPAQSGEKPVLPPLSPARFRQDGIDTDVFTFFKNALGGVVNAIFMGAFSNYDRALLMNQHMAFNYKFLIYNPATGSDGEIVHDFPDAYTGGPVGGAPDERYNYPMWFKEGHPGNLYTDFHFIDDPRSPGSTQWDFRFQFKFNCTQLADFSFDKTVRLIKGGAIVLGRVKELEVDHNKKIITVSGVV